MRATPASGERAPATPPAARRRAATAGRRIVDRVLRQYSGPVALRLWTGYERSGQSTPRCTVVFHHAAALRDLVLRRSLLRAAEDYLAGQIDIRGDMQALFDLVDYLASRRASWRERLAQVRDAMSLLGHAPVTRVPRASASARRNSPVSIAHHYDVSNDFYRLWLDPQLVYSCAYFRDSSQSLAEAQRDKLDLICRKLCLEPGLELLDVGCGWGALAIHAARHYGVRAHGITLSTRQHELATQRIEEEGLEALVSVEQRDYRDLPREPRYDRIVSVGMFEHLGPGAYPTYFGIIRDCLRPGGLFLNHGISNESGWQPRSFTARFINRYVFPDGMLAPISDVLSAMEQAGLEIIDVDGLRRHYALTLSHWVRRLEQHADAAIHEVGEARYRVWRMYMSGSAHYFARGELNVYQVLTGHRGAGTVFPLRREAIYRA